MQWIKHMTDMVDDPKIRRLIRRHGALGYAVYNLAIERIGKRLTTDHVVPDLEETSEDIADLLREDTVKVEESMLTAMQLGLFEQDEVTGRLLCSKVYKFLEQSQTSSKKLRKMITDYRGKVMTRHGDIMTDHDDVSDPMIKSEEIRLEKNRTEENRTEARDPVKASYVEAIGQLLPTTAWPDTKGQWTALAELVTMTRATQPSTPIESPEDFAKMLVATYTAMKRRAKSDYWKTASFEPKAIARRFGEVATEMAKAYEDDAAVSEFEAQGAAAMERMWGKA